MGQEPRQLSRMFLTEDAVKFKLVYQGQLASIGSVREKHDIRRQLHKQLAELWNVQAPFSRWKTQTVVAQNSPSTLITVVEAMAEQYKRCGFRFVPLFTKGRSLACALDIQFLRRDHPGDLVKPGGDLDNRMKTLLDALRMPSDASELGGCVPDVNENPFFVLLEDDSLITELNIATDRLLTPPGNMQHVTDVHLVIGVRVIVTAVDMQLGNLPFLGS